MRASDLIAVAVDELGYIGKAHPTDDLYIKEAPNGKGKYNKYSVELAKQSYYNSSKSGADYCCIFCDYCAYIAAGQDKAKATAVKPLAGGGCGAGVKYARSAYDNIGKEPRVGAQVFYKDSEGYFAHTGLVEKVYEDGSFDTIEGNWGNAVVRRSHIKIGDKYDVGKGVYQYVEDFGYPSYEAEPVPTPTDVVTIPREEYTRMVSQLAEYSVRAEKAEEAQKLAEIELANIKNALKNLI